MTVMMISNMLNNAKEDAFASYVAPVSLSRLAKVIFFFAFSLPLQYHDRDLTAS